MAKKKSRGAPCQLVTRPPSEYQGLLADHLDSLALFCIQFDRGSLQLASEIATNLRVLLHHNPSRGTESLVHQMGLQNTSFCDTERACVSGQPSFGFGPFDGFVSLLVKEGPGGELTEAWGPSPATAKALLKFRTPFVDWWASAVLPTTDHSFSRKRIITLMANQDRGAHVAPSIDKAFFALTRQNSHASAFKYALYHGDYVSEPSRPLRDEDRIPIDNRGSGTGFARALVRQFAHEVLLTLLPDPGHYIAQLPPPATGVMGPRYVIVRFTTPRTDRSHWPVHTLAPDDFPGGNNNSPFEG